MQAFKLNLKLIWKRLPSLSIYLIIFVAISVIVANSISRTPVVPDMFEPTKIDGAFFSDGSSPLVDGLKEELSKNINFVDVKDSQDVLTELLYWQEITYIVRVPEHFTDDLLAGNEPKIERTTVPNSAYGVYADMAIDRYLQTANRYIEFMPDLDESSLAQKIQEDLNLQIDISFGEVEDRTDTVYSQYFFNYMAYSMLAILILGMGIMIASYKDPELKRRNHASPQSLRSQTLGFVLANLTFALGTWAIFVISCILLDPENATSEHMLWFVINSLVFTFAASALSYMLGNLVKSANAVDAVSNVVSLGTAFISGAFVPQEFLGESVLRIARFTPVYWFILGNNRIAEASTFNSSVLESIFLPMLVVLGFSLIFILVSILSMRRQRMKY